MPTSSKLLVIFFLLSLLCLSCKNSNKLEIRKGKDYLATPRNLGSTFDFGPEIGLVLMQGIPSGPGNAAFIWERLDDLVLNGLGDSDTVDFKVVGLTSESRVPINISNVFYDVKFYLDEENPSIGSMIITQDSLDDGGPKPEGSFSTELELFFHAEFVPISKGPDTIKFSGSVLLPSAKAGKWSLDPEDNFVHDSESSNFFHVGDVSYGVPGMGGHTNSASDLTIPAPNETELEASYRQAIVEYSNNNLEASLEKLQFVEKYRNQADDILLLSVMYNELGKLYDKMGYLDQAKSSFDKAIDFNLKHTKEAMSQFPISKFEVKSVFDEPFVNRAHTLVKIGNLEKAILDFDKYIIENPGLALPYIYKGNALLSGERVEKAIVNYDLALEISPNSAQALMNRGNAYLAVGNSEDALEDLNRSLILEKDLDLQKMIEDQINSLSN